MAGPVSHTEDAFAIALVGRDDVLTAATSLFAHRNCRLLTITGPAGVGKTRLGAELLLRHGPPAGRDVVTLDLTALRDPAELDAELIRVAGIPSEGDGDSATRWLASRDRLVLLDNAEHLTGIGPRLTEWLAAAPRLMLIVTSRQRLNLSVETELELQPLETVPADRAALSPAAELLARMAGATDPASLPPDTRGALERLATRLEGLPLALELVAARLPSLTAGDITAMLHATDALGRALPSVASTLDLAVERSYRLLDAPAQALMRYLTIVRGGFSLELAERLVAHARPPDLDGVAVADTLAVLSDHHLVLPQLAVGPSPRFGMLAMVAEAVGRHREALGETPLAHEAHARAVTDFAEAREYAGLWPGHEREVAELGANFHNVMAAIAWLRDTGNHPALLRLVGALTWFWYSQGHYAHGLYQYQRVLDLDIPRHGRIWARFLTGHGLMLDLVARFADAREALLASRAEFERIGAPDGLATSSIALGLNAMHLASFGDAQAAFDRAIRHARDIPDSDLGHAIEAIALANIGANAHEQGDLITADASLRGAIEIHEHMRFQWGAARGLCDLGGVLRDAGRGGEALRAYRQALEPAAALGDHRLIAVALAGAATVLIGDGQYRIGAWFFGGVDALRPVAGRPSFLRVNERAWQQARESARQAVGAATWGSAWSAGARASLPELLAVAATVELFGAEGPSPTGERLTRQERAVLRLVVQDLPTGTIAAILGVTERTVSSHLSALFRKFDVNSRLELIALARQPHGHRPGVSPPR